MRRGALAAVAMLAFGNAVAIAGAAADLAAVRALEARSQWAAAESLATATLARLERDPAADSLALAEASYLVASAHARQAGYADGKALAVGLRSLGIRARRLGPADPAVAEAELLVGRVFQGQDRGDSALVHLQRAVDIRSRALAPNDTLIAEAWDQLALAHRDHREFRLAIEAWDHAIAVRSMSDGAESPAVAVLQAQTGACWMELGDRQRARQVLEGSLATFARIGAPDHPSRWIPLNILADLEKRDGNVARDVDLLQEALRIVRLEFGDDSRQALTIRQNLAAALMAFGDFGGAYALSEELYPRMIAQYGASHWRANLIRQGLAIASAHSGRGAEGLRRFAELESVIVANGGPSQALLPAVQLQHADLLTRMGRMTEALQMCDRSLQSALANRPISGADVAEPYFIRIRTLAALGDTVALARARRGLDTLTARFGSQTGYSSSTLPGFAALADEGLGRHEAAWAEALEGERMMLANARTNLRRLSSQHGIQYARRVQSDLDLVLDLARGDEARTEPAWDCLVRTRGLIRTELAQRAVPRGFESDSALAGAHERWRAAQDQFARLLVHGSRDSASRVALDHAHSEADESERRYAAALEKRGAGALPREHGLADVRSRLMPGQALVSFAVVHAATDTPRVLVFLSSAADPHARRIELGAASDLQSVIDPWRHALSASPGSDARAAARAERECRRLGAKVRSRIWDPVAARLQGASEVFVVADGPLEDLPWPALPDGAKGYLVEREPLIHPLDSELALVYETPAATSGRLLAVGAPDFDRSAAPVRESGPVVAAVIRAAPDPCAEGGALALPALPGSGAEANAVAAAWRAAGAGPTTVLEGEAAEEAAVKEQAPGCTVIHLATHGLMRGDRCSQATAGSRGMGGVAAVAVPAQARRAAQAAPPAVAPPELPVEPSPWLVRRVWLALAGANRSAEHLADDNEGLLTAEEVATLDLTGTDWVVLSACHSGVGDPWSSEGRLGMRRAFSLAGARSVIASGWALDDAATGEWMTALYNARLHGQTDASTAIRSASRAVLAARRATRRPTHPFYWAAFTASGD